MLEKLKSETGPTKDVWFATAKGDPDASTFQMTLQDVFEEAGWRVRGNTPIPFSMSPGIFFLTADQDPPSYVETAYGALADAAGISLGGGRRYREFYAKKKQEDPKWDGIELAPDQTYLIAVGPKPAS